MKRIALASAALILLFCAHSQARESVWRHFSRPDIAFSVYSYAIDYRVFDEFGGGSLTDDPTHYGVSLGFYFPAVHLAEHFTAGISPGFGIVFAPSRTFRDFSTGLTYSVGGNSFSLEIPVYATLKIGTDATWKGVRKFGVGGAVGIGYHRSFLFFADGPENAGFGLPVFMLEANLGKRRGFGLIKLRYTGALGTAEEDLLLNGATVGQRSFEHWAFHLVFTPGY